MKKNFELFIRAQKKHSRENGLVKGFLIDEKRYWRAPDEEHKNLSWTDPKEYARICEKKMSRIEGCLDLPCAPRDPFNIPELRDLLNHPEKLQRPKTKKEVQRRLEPELAKIATQEPRSYSSPTNFRVPVDIIFMIMDYLHEDNDNYALICLFPVWRSMISQAAWRRKCIKDLLLVEPLPHVNELDWRYLYFNVDRLLRKSHEWVFRRRVMDNLKRIRKSFLEEVAQKPG